MKPIESTILQAPAKINLLLRVTSRRADGFHRLVTVFHALHGISDTITVKPGNAPGIILHCDDPEIPVDSGNLILKAAELFAERTGTQLPPMEIDLHKNIPTAAGMGGGSSDAGTVLKFLNTVNPLLSNAELNQLASLTGADVPFFLAPGDAVARGIGEELTSLKPFPAIPVLAVFPAFPVRAAWAYKNLKQMTPEDKAEKDVKNLISALRCSDFETAAQYCENDLEHALFAKFPLLNDLRKQIFHSGALCVHVSGSGPVLWAMFKDHKSLRAAAGELGSDVNISAGIRIMEC